MFAHGSARLRGGCGGQGTVEAAFALPVLLALMVLAVQPGIYLYDRMCAPRILNELTDWAKSQGVSDIHALRQPLLHPRDQQRSSERFPGHG